MSQVTSELSRNQLADLCASACKEMRDAQANGMPMPCFHLDVGSMFTLLQLVDSRMDESPSLEAFFVGHPEESGIRQAIKNLIALLFTEFAAAGLVQTAACLQASLAARVSPEVQPTDNKGVVCVGWHPDALVPSAN